MEFPAFVYKPLANGGHAVIRVASNVEYESRIASDCYPHPDAFNLPKPEINPIKAKKGAKHVQN